MRVLLLLCVLEALLLSGCRKKTSEEFYKLESAHSVLVAREGDEAYVNDEMATILLGLRAVPDDAMEKPRAMELVGKIVAEQARVQAEKAEAAAPQPPAPVANPFAGSEVTPPPEPTPAPDEPPADEADAGPPAMVPPWPGMPEKAFVERFGKCFTGPGKSALPDGKPATAYLLNPSADCQKQHGAKDTRVSYLFTDKGLWGKAEETVTVVDAGVLLITPPAPPPPPPPGPPIITTPGAPEPEGYEKVGP